MSELSNTDGRDINARLLRFNNNPKYDRKGNLLKMDDLTNIEKGWVNEWQFIHANINADGVIGYELKLMLDTTKFTRLFIETASRFNLNDKLTPTGLEISTASEWIITFVNLKGRLKTLRLSTDDIWNMIRTEGVEPIFDLPVGEGGKVQYKTGYSLSFYMILKYYIDFIFGLDEEDYHLTRYKLDHREYEVQKYTTLNDILQEYLDKKVDE